MQIMDKGLESLQEVSKKCLDTQNTFVKCKQALQLKKEKLFVTKNFQAWELPDDKKDLINNKLEAVKLMLPKATQDITCQQNYVGFFFNQFKIQSEEYFKSTHTILSFLMNEELAQSMLFYSEISKCFQSVMVHINIKRP